MARNQRFKPRRSDRSGFRYLEKDMVRENGLWIGPDEVDDPPPSKISLGGEGDVSRGDYFRDSTALTIDSNRENPVVYVTAAGGITINTHPYMRVSGSNGAIDISVNPQISVGREGQVLTLFGVGSDITLENANGLALMGSSSFVIGSGSVITFIYNSGNNAWNETSRNSNAIGG